MTLRRFLELLRFAGILLAVWIAAGLFATSNVYRNQLVLGGKVILSHILYVQMSTALIWAAVTPLLIHLGTRLQIRKPHRLRNTVLLILWIPPLAVVRAAVGSAIMNLGERDPIALAMANHSILIRFHANVLTLGLIFLVLNVILAQREAAERERNALAKRTLLARAEIEELRSHLQPHFLFTTLQTIGRVLHDSPEKADAMIVHLSDLLRQTLALREDEISLGEELDFIDRYLELYRDVFSGRLRVTLHAEEDLLDARVPPLLLQPVVESTVVNAIEPAGGGTIAIRVDRNGEMLRIEVAADRPAVQTDESGLTLARERLRKLFGEKQSLDADPGTELSRVFVRIPLLCQAGDLAKPA